MTRTELIAKYKLWQVYSSHAPDVALCEGSRTVCIRYLREKHLYRSWRHGRGIHLAQIISEAAQ